MMQQSSETRQKPVEKKHGRIEALKHDLKVAIGVFAVAIIAAGCNLTTERTQQQPTSTLPSTPTEIALNDIVETATALGIDTATVLPSATQTPSPTAFPSVTRTPSPSSTPTIDIAEQVRATQTVLAEAFVTPTATNTPGLSNDISDVATNIARSTERIETAVAEMISSPTATASETATWTQTPTPTTTETVTQTTTATLPALESQIGVTLETDEGHTLNRTNLSMVRATGGDLVTNFSRSSELETLYGQQYLDYNRSYAIISGAVPSEITGDPSVTVLYGINNPQRNPLDIRTLRVDFGLSDIQYAANTAQPLFDSSVGSYTDPNGEPRLALQENPGDTDFSLLWNQSGATELRSRVSVPSIRDMATALTAQFIGAVQTLNSESTHPLTEAEVVSIATQLTNDVLARDWYLSEDQIRSVTVMQDDGTVTTSGIAYPIEEETCRVEDQVDVISPTFGDRVDQVEHLIRVPVDLHQGPEQQANYGTVGEEAAFASFMVLNTTEVSGEMETAQDVYGYLHENVTVTVLGDEELGVRRVPTAYEQSPSIERSDYTEFTMDMCGVGDVTVATEIPTVESVASPYVSRTETPVITATPTSTTEITATPAPTNTHNPPTATESYYTPTMPSPTVPPTRPPENTVTPRPTNTPVPTETRRPTNTPIPTETPRPTNTLVPPTNTPVPTNTPYPTETPAPTNTHNPPTATESYYTEVPPTPTVEPTRPSYKPVVETPTTTTAIDQTQAMITTSADSVVLDAQDMFNPSFTFMPDVDVKLDNKKVKFNRTAKRA